MLSTVLMFNGGAFCIAPPPRFDPVTEAAAAYRSQIRSRQRAEKRGQRKAKKQARSKARKQARAKVRTKSKLGAELLRLWQLLRLPRFHIRHPFFRTSMYATCL